MSDEREEKETSEEIVKKFATVKVSDVPGKFKFKNSYIEQEKTDIKWGRRRG